MNKKVGNYMLESELGRGQFGVVYLASLVGDPQALVAIKCVSKINMAEQNPIVKRLFKTELLIMTQIKHPNIMPLSEFLETVNSFYLVMPYCDGGDLERLVNSQGRLPFEQAVFYLIQIMNGFQELYKHKIIHRDIKLANLFLRGDRVIIGDFGFAKLGFEVTNTQLGTPLTTAPEILFGAPGDMYNSKVDLWSIGVCFYQMLFGRSPFKWESEVGINRHEMRDRIEQTSGKRLAFPEEVPVSPVCRQLLVSLLEFQPEARLGWREFFNHELFGNYLNLHQATNNEAFSDSIKHDSQIEFARNKDKINNDVGGTDHVQSIVAKE